MELIVGRPKISKATVAIDELVREMAVIWEMFPKRLSRLTTSEAGLSTGVTEVELSDPDTVLLGLVKVEVEGPVDNVGYVWLGL